MAFEEDIHQSTKNVKNQRSRDAKVQQRLAVWMGQPTSMYRDPAKGV